jgi:hypothetical protein
LKNKREIVKKKIGIWLYLKKKGIENGENL